MKRKSLKMQPADWLALTRLAHETNSYYAGRPSWRRLIVRIARGKFTVRAARHALCRPSAVPPENLLAGEARSV